MLFALAARAINEFTISARSTNFKPTSRPGVALQGSHASVKRVLHANVVSEKRSQKHIHFAVEAISAPHH